MSKPIICPREDDGTPAGFPRHPYSEIWEGYDVTELRDGIKAHGLLGDDIVLLDEPRGSGRNRRVLDGNMRQRACIAAGVEPRYRMFGAGQAGKNDGDDPRYFAYKAVCGRQLTAPQRNEVALKYANLTKGANQHTKEGPQTCGGSAEKPMSMASAAKKGGVKKRSLESAKLVLSKGAPELQDAYRAELVSVSDAAAIATEPPDVQRAAVAAVLEGTAKTLRAAVATIAPKEPTPEDHKEIARDLLAIAERGTRVKLRDPALQAQLVANLRTIAAAFERG